jgi:hypothetical protein
MIVKAQAIHEVAQFIASHPTPEQVIAFHPSLEATERAYALIYAERTGTSTDDERAELENYTMLENLIELAKIEAHRQLQRQDHMTVYTIHDLIVARIQAQRTRNFRQADLAEYYRRRNEALQAAFGIHFTHEELPSTAPRALPMLFTSTIDSYLALRTPFSGYLEAGLGVAEMAEEFGQPFQMLYEQGIAEHWKLLNTLFERWYGTVTKTVTSEDLLRYGFDDSQPVPQEDL